MRIFNSEVHGTALVFICLDILECSVYSFITVEIIGRKEALIIVWFAVVFSFVYWLATYANTHFKNNHNENES